MARTKNYERAAVIELLTQVFIEKGYESTSMADLMDKTGLNKKSLYNEFGSKEAMFETVLAQFIEHERAGVTPIMAHQPLGIENIRGFFSYLETRFANTGCLLTLSLNESACISDTALGMINQSFKKLEQALLINLLALFDEAQAIHFARNLLIMMLGVASLTRSPELRENNFNSVSHFLDFLQASAKTNVSG